MRRASLVGAIIAVCLVLVPPAGAEDGVTVDPDSPSGKEYQLPLDEARNKGAGGDRGAAAGGSGTPGAGSGGGAGAPAFGQGITPRGGGEGAGSGSAGRPAASGGSGGAGQPGAGSLSGQPSSPQDSGSGSGYAIALTAGALVAVLAIGGAAGFALRRRTNPAG